MLIYSCTVPYYSETHRVNEISVVVLALHHLPGDLCSLLPGALLRLCSFWLQDLVSAAAGDLRAHSI